MFRFARPALLFSSNVGTRLFGLGKKHDSEQAFLDEFKTIKPCIHGSDAHSYDALFAPAEGRFLWIKADPTFQGLIQLLHEPAERVFIGAEPPALESVAARPTRVVDSVSIRKRPRSSLKETWFNCSIPLNPELVAIIGNKGSGKSAFADILGLLGNTPRHRSFSFLKGDRFRDRSSKAQHFDASLSWADGRTEGPRSLDMDPEKEAVEKIRYIPQNYLEEICNEVGSGKGSRFYAELQQVIFSHVPEPEKLTFTSLDELLEHRGDQIQKAIEILVTELKTLNRTITNDEARLSERHRKTVELQLDERRRALQAHLVAPPPVVPKPEDDPASQEQSKLTASNLEARQEHVRVLDAELLKFRGRDAVLAKSSTTADRLLGRLRNLKRQVEGSIAEAASEFAELGLAQESVVSFTLNEGPVTAMLADISAERAKLAAELDPKREGSAEYKKAAELAEVAKLQESLTLPQRAYQTYLQKLKEWEFARDKIQGTPEVAGSIAQLERELTDLDALPAAVKKLYRARSRKALEIFCEKRKLRAYYESYYGAVQQFLSEHPLAASGHFKLTFDVAIVESGFSNEFLAKINQRKVGSFAGVDEGAAEVKRLTTAADWNSPRGVVRFLREVVAKLRKVDGRPIDLGDQLVQGQTPESLYDFLYSLGYLAPIYRLTWDGKGLEQLSPGERGNLLLIFYLLVDTDDIPLVIDQPEENLDNQTVVRTLVPCIKDAKQRRQIVMVTHNPNLAVVCDAEQVIYAEIQKEHGNEVRYLSGAIEEPQINRKILDVLEGTRPAFDKRDAKYIP